MNAAPTTEAVAPPQQMTVPLIAVGDLVPTPDNPRIVRENDETIKTLAASIRSVGVLEPVLARPHPTRPGKYDLRAGFRRLQAAKLAGLTEIPCIVRELDDAEAMEITVTENLEREELHPIEEAKGIQTLLSKGWDEQSIASRLDRTPQWVARRASLTRLHEQLKSWAMHPEHALHNVPTGILERCARLAREAQEEIVKDIRETTKYNQGNLPWMFESVAKLDREVSNRWLHQLKQAPWKIDDETIHPEIGACSRCPKRSSAQPLLFDDEAEAGKKKTDDRCLDPVCWNRKAANHVQIVACELRKQHSDVILLQANTSTPSPEVKKRFGQVMGEWSVTKSTKSDTKARPALIVAGPGQGTVQYVKLPASTNGSRKAGAGKSKADGVAKPRPLKERREELENRRKALVVMQLRERLTRLADGKDPVVPPDAYTPILALLAAFGTSHRRDIVDHTPNPWKAYDKAMAEQDQGAGSRLILYRSLFKVWAARLNPPGAKYVGRFYADAQRMMQVLSIDEAAMRAQAERSIPAPKAWRNLQADGTPKSIDTARPAQKAKAKP